MKTLREQFEEDYIAVSVPANERNRVKIRYVYYAPWYCWDLPASVLNQKKLLLAGVSVGSLLLFLLAGIQETSLNTYVFVALPGTLALCAHVLELFGVFQFQYAKYRTSRMTYFSIDRILNCVPLIRGVSLLAAAAAGVSYMIRNAFQLQAVLVTGGYLACALMALFIFKEYRKIPLKTEKNNMPEGLI